MGRDEYEICELQCKYEYKQWLMGTDDDVCHARSRVHLMPFFIAAHARANTFGALIFKINTFVRRAHWCWRHTPECAIEIKFIDRKLPFDEKNETIRG